MATLLGLVSVISSGCSTLSGSQTVHVEAETTRGGPLSTPTTLEGSPTTTEDCKQARLSPDSGRNQAPLALGAFVRRIEEEPSKIDQYIDTVGDKPAIAMLYQNWENESEFDRAMLNAMTSRGIVPMLTWAPRDPVKGKKQREYSLQKIARGRYDLYVRRWAREAAEWGEPLQLRFAHEMNADLYPWGLGVSGNTSADYVAAWRHIHDIFTQEGASNVQWVWSPLADTPTSKAVLERLYPGDDYVDWMALDGYNWGTEGPALQEWRTVAEIFGPSYDKLAGISDKPMMIAEVASAEGGGNKALWIRDGLLKDVPSRLPRVRAVVWFDSNKIMDWRVNSSPDSLEAYKDVATSCLYAAEKGGYNSPH